MPSLAARKLMARNMSQVDIEDTQLSIFRIKMPLTYIRPFHGVLPSLIGINLTFSVSIRFLSFPGWRCIVQ